MPKTSKSTSSPFVPEKALLTTGGALGACDLVVGGLAKIPGARAANIERKGGVALVRDTPYVVRGMTIPAVEVYFNRDSRPEGAGAWLGEADKVSWRDPTSGYECIMLRSTEGGYLSGYVGVPTTHPLHGFEYEAIPADFGIEVHGGLRYSEICADGPSPGPRLAAESRRICHVPRELRYEDTVHATGHRVEDRHVWWFGFDCNHAYDVIPDTPIRNYGYLSAETGGTYRDDAYVCQEVLNLAAQLKAIADGADVPARAGAPLPPAALDERRGGRG